MARFMLMFMSGPGKPSAPLPAEELQKVIARYVNWGERVAAEGHGTQVGGRLSDVFTDPGRIVTSRSGDFLVSDGPLAETHEVVGGFTVIEAKDYDEAVELCRDHPAAERGRIVIRAFA